MHKLPIEKGGKGSGPHPKQDYFQTLPNNKAEELKLRLFNQSIHFQAISAGSGHQSIYILPKDREKIKKLLDTKRFSL